MNQDEPRFLVDETARRAAFPIVSQEIYLAHAGVCPLPAVVVGAMERLLRQSQLADQEAAAGKLIEETRSLAASFLGVALEEVALVGPTSNALSLVASGFPLQAGDNVICYRDDYPSNVYPWLALKAKGVEVRMLEVERIGEISWESVDSLVDQRTKLVAMASCHYLSGYRIDLDRIGANLRKRGIAFCVDGIQSLGAFPMSLENVDFMAADSHKWLLGPCSAGVLYVRREWLDRLKVSGWGWHNTACPSFLAAEQIELLSTAEKYEPGTANLVGLSGLQAALQLLTKVGPETVASRLQRHRCHLVEGLKADGFEVLGEGADVAQWGGMLSFSDQRRSTEALFKRLAAAKVRASLRFTRDGREWLRFSPHFYNVLGELDAALDCLRDCP